MREKKRGGGRREKDGEDVMNERKGRGEEEIMSERKGRGEGRSK